MLLISDATADKAAAAMDVRVGSWGDPERFQGLAHFCEHMLFMGTKPYPSEVTSHKACSWLVPRY